MPTFVITEARREIWHYYHVVEAENEEEAEKLYWDGDPRVETSADGEFQDSVASDVVSVDEE